MRRLQSVRLHWALLASVHSMLFLSVYDESDILACFAIEVSLVANEQIVEFRSTTVFRWVSKSFAKGSFLLKGIKIRGERGAKEGELSPATSVKTRRKDLPPRKHQVICELIGR